jgi:hypothetical protein
MRHFSPAEFVDAADRALPPARAAHLDRCARCRDQAAAVQAALAAARGSGESDVPEPSPLYWQHFAANVRARVAAEAISPAWRAGGWRELVQARALVPIASVLIVIAAVFVAGELRRSPAPVAAPDVTPAPARLAAEAVEPENSDAWLVLTSAAAEMPIEDAHAAGMGVPSAAIDRAVQRMSPEELSELGRLLRTEMRGSSD